MNIDVEILIKAVKCLPYFEKWEEDTWVFLSQRMAKKKCRRLTFVKNYNTHRWDLLI